MSDYNRARREGPRGDFTAVREILRKALKIKGIDEKVAKYQFVLHWKEIVGEQIASRTKPECLRNRVLVVRVIDSTWAQELSFQKGVILSRLSRFLNEGEQVNDIYFYVSP